MTFGDNYITVCLPVFVLCDPFEGVSPIRSKWDSRALPPRFPGPPTVLHNFLILLFFVKLLEIAMECLPIGAHLTIWQLGHHRYTVQGIAHPPDPLYPPQPCNAFDYKIVTMSPFELVIYRKGTHEPLWHLAPRLVFEDQYIEITTLLPPSLCG